MLSRREKYSEELFTNQISSKSFVRIGDCARITFGIYVKMYGNSNFVNLISPLNLVQPKRYFISRPLEALSTNWHNFSSYWEGGTPLTAIHNNKYVLDYYIKWIFVMICMDDLCRNTFFYLFIIKLYVEIDKVYVGLLTELKRNIMATN